MNQNDDEIHKDKAAEDTKKALFYIGSSLERVQEISNKNRLGYVSRKKIGEFKKLIFYICGIESLLKANYVETSDDSFKMDTSIESNPYWSKVCSINAVIVFTFTGFVVAFFNKFD